MAYNSRVQMDTTGSGSLSGGRVLDKLTRIDKNMALIQKDIRTLVRKSASDRAGSFFANEDARESSMEGSRVKRGGSKGFSFSRDVKAGAKKGEGMMNALFGGIVTGLLGGLLGVMGKVIGGVAVLGYKLVSKLVASIAAAYGITSMGGAIEKGKFSPFHQGSHMGHRATPCQEIEATAIQTVAKQGILHVGCREVCQT